MQTASQAEKLKNRSFLKIIVYICILLLVGAVVGLGMNFIYKKTVKPSEKTEATQVSGKAIDGINFSGDLPDSALKEISKILRSAYQPDYLPKDLEVKLVTKAEQTGDQYVGTWTTQGKIFFVLFVADKTNNSSRYMRTWVLDTGTITNQQLASTSVTNYFNQDFIKTVGDLSCTTTKNPEGGDELVTDCANVSTDSEKNKVGISVRAPVSIQANEKGTSTAACMITFQTSALYTYKSCL